MASFQRVACSFKGGCGSNRVQSLSSPDRHSHLVSSLQMSNKVSSAITLSVQLAFTET